MNIDLDPEHVRLAASVRSLLEKLAPTEVIADLDRREAFPAGIYRELAAAGLCGLTVAREYGGSSADFVSLALVAEELARAGNTLVAAWEPTVCFAAQAIQRFGTEQQRRAILPAVTDGTVHIALGLSEPDAGSDLSHLATCAVRDGGDFLISGTKCFVTGADNADYLLALTRTGDDGPARSSLSMFVVPSGARGISYTVQPKLCSQGVHLCTVALDGVRVPAASLLGELGGGARLVAGLLDGERILTGAKGVGIARAAADLALDFATNRRQFGCPVIEFQGVGHLIADMVAEAEAARLLVLRAAWLRAEGRDCTLESSMAKLVGSTTGTRCAERGMQILGGYSYLVANGMERLYREAKLYEIGGGTSQIQRNIILRTLRSRSTDAA